MTRSFDIFFGLRLNKRLSKQSWGWDLWHHCAHYDVTVMKSQGMIRNCTRLVPVSGPECLKMSIIRHICIRYAATAVWWRHQTETFSTLLILCEGNPPVTGGVSSQRTVTRSLDVFFDLRLNKRLSKQPRRWWFETPSRSLWHRIVINATTGLAIYLHEALSYHGPCHLMCVISLIPVVSTPWFHQLRFMTANLHYPVVCLLYTSDRSIYPL